jgi:hypothetical protein
MGCKNVQQHVRCNTRCLALAYACTGALCSQAFVQNGDVTQLDQGLFVQLLSAVVLQHAGGQAASTQQLLQEAQHLLQQLSADACLVLLEELLPSFVPAKTSSSSGMQDAAVVQLTAPALAHLLTHALLPQLHSLGAAAPKSMLSCLTLLGESSASRLCSMCAGFCRAMMYVFVVSQHIGCTCRLTAVLP